MTNKFGKNTDKTYLSVDQAEERGFIHRDYIAHCLRWSHVIKCLSTKAAYKTATILDIGCGRETPLAKMLYSSRMAPEFYIGIDYGPINTTPFEGKSKFNGSFWPKVDFTVWEVDLEKPATHITCFEMLEHIEPNDCIRTLINLGLCADENTRIFLSTPCWDRVHTAANHVNEMTYEALGAIIEALDYEIVATYGTFASIRDYKDELTEGERFIFEELRSYYDVNVLSCIFAPLYPQHSRNALWEIKPGLKERKFECLSKLKEPWSSSEKWEDFRSLITS